jgi:hypothetical protein
VVAGIFDLPWHNGSGVSFSYAARPDAPAVAVLDGSGNSRFARRTPGRMRRAAFRVVLAARLPAPAARTQVRFAPGRRAVADAVRTTLHAGRVGPLDAATRAGLNGGRADVVVVVGRDVAHR